MMKSNEFLKTIVIGIGYSLLIFLLTTLIGMIAGPPIIVIAFDLSGDAELGELLGLLIINFWYYLLILCILSFVALRLYLKKATIVFKCFYTISVSLLISLLFFGITVSNYFQNLVSS